MSLTYKMKGYMFTDLADCCVSCTHLKGAWCSSWLLLDVVSCPNRDLEPFRLASSHITSPSNEFIERTPSACGTDHCQAL